MKTELDPLLDFLGCRTPDAWLKQANANLPLLLIDHAHCERKAAFSAFNLISMAPENANLVNVMSPLIREEMLHFEKVLQLLRIRNIAFTALAPSSYAATLHRMVHKKDKRRRLVDLLLIGAIIEARSCERFASLLDYLQDRELSQFYRSLVKAEARHFCQYLSLVQDYEPDYHARLSDFLQEENRYIHNEDAVYRFHSGIPCTNDD
ncbi:MAG: tRNA-(ms[2]io[6]A)-hydroxylase [Legionellaceae bacterium]|nr:tRNA-(ms[2]io[6]A)-hydroxylase [Legionellaceae bacterium]